MSNQRVHVAEMPCYILTHTQTHIIYIIVYSRSIYISTCHIKHHDIHICVRLRILLATEVMNSFFAVQFSPWSRLRDSGLVLSFWQRSLWHGLQHFHGVGFGAWAASLGIDGEWFWVIQVHLESKLHENNMEYCWGNLNSCIHILTLSEPEGILYNPCWLMCS